MSQRPNRTADPPPGDVTASGKLGPRRAQPEAQQAEGPEARRRAVGPGRPGPGGNPAAPNAVNAPHPTHDDAAPVYVISIAAQLAGMHPQTLRSYDRLGLVTPGRSAGRGRRYSARDVALLREVQRLSQEEGVNLEGIRRILELEDQVTALRAKVRELADELERTRAEADRRVAEAHASHRRDLVPVERGAVVIWRPGKGRR